MRFNAVKVYFSLASEPSAGGRGGRRELTSAPSSHEGTQLLPSILPHPLGLGVFHWVLCIQLADREREAHEEPWGGCAIGGPGGQEMDPQLCHIGSLDYKGCWQYSLARAHKEQKRD